MVGDNKCKESEKVGWHYYANKISYLLLYNIIYSYQIFFIDFLKNRINKKNMIERLKNLFRKKEPVYKPSIEEKIYDLFESLNNNTLTVFVGDDLIELEDFILDITCKLREEIKDECGFIIPKVNIKYNEILQENELTVLINKEKKADIYIVPNKDGIEEEFYDTLKTVIYENINLIFTYDVVEKYIDSAQRKNSWLIWNITRILSVTEIKTILCDIINNGKSIDNINYIFGKIGEQILNNGNFRDPWRQECNPHIIANEVIKCL